MVFQLQGTECSFRATKEGEGIVTAIYPRKTELRRQDRLIAANIDQLWLIVAVEPHYQFELIDRYLVIAEDSNLPINIVVNKIELSKNSEQLINDFSHYEALGYGVHFLSVKNETNLKEFKTKLVNKSHIFLGQSGVGKSSLINSLIPDLELRVNEISSKSKLGKHTTTNTTIYHIPSGGDLIDSPGIREFQLDNLSERQIVNGFREFKSLAGECRFRNCHHINEPGCVVKNAVELGVINSNRYESYLNILP